MAEAGNRNDGAVPVNLPGGVHVVRPLEMVEAAIAAMVAPLLAAAERVPRPLRLVVLLVISLIIREALCEEARQLLNPEQLGAICTLISSDSPFKAAPLYFGANLLVMLAAALRLTGKLVFSMLSLQAFRPQVVSYITDVLREFYLNVKEVGISLWNGRGFVSRSSYEELFGYNDLSDKNREFLMSNCKGFGPNVLEDISSPSEGWEFNVLGLVIVMLTVTWVMSNTGGNWARRKIHHALIAAAVVTIITPSSLIRSIAVPLLISPPQHFWMEAPQSPKFDSFFRVLPPILAGIGVSMNFPPEAVNRVKRFFFQWFFSIKLLAYSESIANSPEGVEPFKTVIYTALVLHMVALLSFFCISGARAFLNRQPGRNWRHVDRPPRQIQINIGFVMDGVEMAAPPGLMTAAPGYDAGNIGRLTTLQLDNLQKALKGVAKAVATEIGVRGGADDGPRDRSAVSEGENGRCVACWERPEVIFEPCGHACFCSDCFHKWQFENCGGSMSAQRKRQNCAICDIPVLDNILIDGARRMQRNLNAITQGTSEEAEDADSTYYTTRSVARLIADVRHNPSLMAKCSSKAKAEFKKLL